MREEREKKRLETKALISRAVILLFLTRIINTSRSHLLHWPVSEKVFRMKFTYVDVGKKQHTFKAHKPTEWAGEMHLCLMSCSRKACLAALLTAVFSQEQISWPKKERRKRFANNNNGIGTEKKTVCGSKWASNLCTFVENIYWKRARNALWMRIRRKQNKQTYTHAISTTTTNDHIPSSPKNCILKRAAWLAGAARWTALEKFSVREKNVCTLFCVCLRVVCVLYTVAVLLFVSDVEKCAVRVFFRRRRLLLLFLLSPILLSYCLRFVVFVVCFFCAHTKLHLVFFSLSKSIGTAHTHKQLAP